MDFFGFGSPSAHIEITFDPIGGRKPRTVQTSEGTNQYPVFSADEEIHGKTQIHIPAGKKLEHLGIKAELKGIVEVYHDKANPVTIFSESIDLCQTGTLNGISDYNFHFSKPNRPYESYHGINARCQYFVVVTINRNYSSNVSQKSQVLIQKLQEAPQQNNPIQMEVGIEDCLHIEFEYNKEYYHLEDMITGRVDFLLVRIKVKHMELSIIRRENTGNATQTFNESDTLSKFEIMDGAAPPVRGEVIPVRLYLSGFDLSPTYTNVADRFSVRYFLNLVLIDEEDRRYFKQHEIKLWRRRIK